jgi:integrase
MSPENPKSSHEHNLTIGLHPAITEFLDYSRRLNCSNIANRLVELTLDGQRPMLLGAMVIFLQSTEITKLCRLWATTNSTFGELADLAEGLWLNPDIASKLGFNDHSIPVYIRFRDDLDRHYLPAMLAAERPSWVEEPEAQWLQATRLWILSLALEVNQIDGASDKHLWPFCREIRICCDRPTSTKISRLTKLKCDPIPSSAQAFESEMRQASQKVLAQDDPAEPAFQALLGQHLKALFKRNWGTTKDTKPFRMPVFEVQPVQTFPSTAFENPGDNESKVVVFADSKGKQSSIGCVNVDENQTPAMQDGATHGVVLLSREDSQLLPWSWHRLTPPERQALIELIGQLGENSDFVARLAGALVAVAYVCARSARQVVDIAIGAGPADDWFLHKKTCKLQRNPPRHSHGWTIDGFGLTSENAASWLRPLADVWSVDLASTLTSTLSEALNRNPKLKTIGQLWHATCPDEELETWLNARFAAAAPLSRLTSPVLAAIVRQEVFNLSEDHVLARLVSSSPSSGLPAPCAYAGFTGSRINASMSVLSPSIAVLTVTPAQNEFNWAGSQLDVIELHLTKKIAQLYRRLEELAKDPARWIEHHNLLVTYVVTALFATTGARPVRSPFESLRWFDFDRGIIFVDDKSAGPTRGSRLCLMTGPVADILRQAFLPHLKRLADSLRTTLADFAQSIDAVLNGDAKPALPLFFFIRSTPSFDWLEVSEAGLSAECGLEDWPLPFNFFRHRMATCLRRRGLDPEIIDALLGHSEAGAETHGKHSLRILAQDLEVARPLVHALTLELGFKIPRRIDRTLLTEVLTPSSTPASLSRRYGTKARALMRKQAHIEARATAIRDLEIAVGDQPPALISSEKWDEIALKMILRKDGLPHAMGSLRYDIFQTYLRSLWDSHGIRPKVKRRFLIGQAGEPIVDEGAIDAPKTLAALVGAFEKIVTQFASRSVGPQFASALAALDASLYGGIADARVLTTIALHANVKAVLFGGRTYVEHFEGDTWLDTMPRRRFEVSPRCVQWLLTGLTERKRMDKLPKLSEKLHALAELVGVDKAVNTGILLARVARVVAQVNVVERSGVAAATLDGRVRVSALPHHDWLRVTTGKAPRTVVTESTADDDIDSKLDALLKKRGHAKIKPQPLEVSCRELFHSIRVAMVGTGDKASKQQAIWELLVASPFEIGDLPFALGQWASHLLTRPSRTKSGRLQDDSAERYFNALAPKVAAVGSTANISDLEDDELLELYSKLLEARAVIKTETDPAKTLHVLPEEQGNAAEVDGDEAEGRHTDGADLKAHEQLYEFHQWAQPIYGLEDPDWSELDEFTIRPAGRPGLIAQSEYLWALEELIGNEATRATPAELVQDAFLLILCYRFGLRGREAYGLLRSDWVDAANTVVVLVRPNFLRHLKNLQSKRQIPRLESFCPLELSIIDEILRRWEERDGVARDTPLLRELTRVNFKQMRLGATRRMRKLLKTATRKSSTTMHHLRHSFACRALALVGGRDFGLGTDCSFDAQTIDNARRLLLGFSHPRLDRRALWAVCRLLGHSSPGSLFKSYFHGQLTDPTPFAGAGIEAIFDRSALIDLDDVEFDEGYLKPIVDRPVQAEVEKAFSKTLESRVNFLRLRLLGYSPSRAAHTTGLEIEFAMHLENYIQSAVARLEVSHPKDSAFLNAVDLCSRIAKIRWKELRVVARGDHHEVLLDGSVDVVGIEVIGRSRQIVLFRREHIKKLAEFVKDLNLTNNDLRILRPLGRGKQLQDLLFEFKLDAFIDPGSLANGTPRQLNVVTSNISAESSQLVTFLDRLVVMICQDGKLADSYELILMWLCWVARG